MHPSNFKFIEFYEQSEKDYGQDLPISTPILIHESIVKDHLSLFKILHKSFRYKERHRMSYNHDGSFDLMKLVDTAKNTSNWKCQESEASDFPEVMQFIVHDKPYSLQVERFVYRKYFMRALRKLTTEPKLDIVDEVDENLQKKSGLMNAKPVKPSETIQSLVNTYL